MYKLKRPDHLRVVRVQLKEPLFVFRNDKGSVRLHCGVCHNPILSHNAVHIDNTVIIPVNGQSRAQRKELIPVPFALFLKVIRKVCIHAECLKQCLIKEHTGSCFGPGSKTVQSAVNTHDIKSGFVPFVIVPVYRRNVGGALELPSFEEVAADKTLYARAARRENAEHDPIRGRTMVQRHGDRYLTVYPPAMPLSTAELDSVAALPYTREPHPMYDAQGGVPAIEEVRFSVIHNRGCFGGCNFCSLAFHQGRMVTSRSHESVIAEVRAMTKHPLWKGYVSDVGGPTADFRSPSCKKQLRDGMCPLKHCLTPKPCKHLEADHSDYLALLRKLREIPGVKKVFVRSGIRFDYVLCDKNSPFLSELVRYHISGQLKVAPEHCVDSVLGYMGKPPSAVYERFLEKYAALNRRYGKDQFLVPYLMSSHPGSTLSDAVALALYLKKHNARPEQVQDFYPTPGTISTCMYYTGIDPITMKEVYVPRSPKEKAMQRALLQYTVPKNAPLVREALRACGREDLIGTGPHCLVRPERNKREDTSSVPVRRQSRGVSGDGRGQKKSPGKPAPHTRADASAPGRGGRKRGRGSGHDSLPS